MALAYRFGVSPRPCRPGSSPTHSRMVRTASPIMVSLLAPSSGDSSSLARVPMPKERTYESLLRSRNKWATAGKSDVPGRTKPSSSINGLVNIVSISSEFNEFLGLADSGSSLGSLAAKTTQNHRFFWSLLPQAPSQRDLCFRFVLSLPGASASSCCRFPSLLIDGVEGIVQFSVFRLESDFTMIRRRMH